MYKMYVLKILIQQNITDELIEKHDLNKNNF